MPLTLAHLERLERRFLPNELAFIMLTGKREYALTDRLAFDLQSARDGRRVAREWCYDKNRYADIAVFDEDRVSAVEVKLAYVHEFSIPSEAQKLFSQLQLDQRNYERQAGVRGWNLLAVSRNLDAIPIALIQERSGNNQNAPIKQDYGKQMNRHIGSDVERHAREKISARIDCNLLTGPVTLRAGVAFGVRVELDLWLVGPTTTDRNILRAA